MFDFDSVLEATNVSRGNGGNIISENHNVGSINFVRGMVDPGEMIGCGMYQELRRNAGESDDTYQVRLLALLANMPTDIAVRITAGLSSAAIKRASLGVTNGKVNFVGVHRPELNDIWHGLGVLVREAMNSAEAMDLSGANYEMGLIPVTYDWHTIGSDGKPTIIRKTKEGSFALVRLDTGKAFAVTGDRYHIIQPRDCFRFTDKLMGEYGAKYETAGVLGDGEKLFLNIRLPQSDFEPIRGDKVLAYANLHSPYDFSGKVFLFASAKRDVCQNTARQNLAAFESRKRSAKEGKGEAKGIGISHHKGFEGKLADARKALGLSVKAFDTYREKSEAMVRKSVKLENYVNDVLDASLDITQAQMAMGPSSLLEGIVNVTIADRQLADKRFEKLVANRSSVLDDILNRANSETCNKAEGTLYQGYQSVTEYADHSRGKRIASDMQLRRERRLDSALTGDRDELKQTALVVAEKYLSN